ncbi:MAG: hypothetical protein QM756_33605 [Polyangiaceae bacterium]
MPSPVSSNSSVSTLSQLPANDDSEVLECKASAQSEPAEITLDPVYVTGELGAELAEQYARSQRTPDCLRERNTAILTCIAVLPGAVGTAASAPTGLGLVAGAAATFVASMNCGAALRAYDDCGEP